MHQPTAGEEMSTRGWPRPYSGTRETPGPNLFSLVAAEGFAPWMDMACLAREGKRYPKRHQPCWACGCSPKNTQHPRAVELMGVRGGTEVSHGPMLSVEQRRRALPEDGFSGLWTAQSRYWGRYKEPPSYICSHLLLLWSDQP